ncbi:polysaccharide pyruvyl transferase family protein [Rhodocyclaceae bacterium SMB388]
MNIVLHASYFAPNFGDALLWNAGIDAVTYRTGGRIYSVNLPRRFASHFAHPALVGNWQGGNVDRFAFLGGGYFYQPRGSTWKWGLRNMVRHRKALSVAAGATKAGVFGVGVGVIDFTPLRYMIHKQLQAADVVCVRDQESLQAVSNDYRRTAKTTVESDQAFAYVVDRYASQFTQIPRQFLSFHIELAGHSQDARRAILDHVRRTAMQQDMPVQLLVDCETRHTADEVATLRSALGPRLSVVTIYRGNLHQFLAAIAASAKLVTTKLHVGICAVALKVPVLAIPKHPKVERFYNQAGLARACLAPSALDSDERLATFPLIDDSAHEFLLGSSRQSLRQLSDFVL